MAPNDRADSARFVELVAEQSQSTATALQAVERAMRDGFGEVRVTAAKLDGEVRLLREQVSNNRIALAEDLTDLKGALADAGKKSTEWRDAIADRLGDVSSTLGERIERVEDSVAELSTSVAELAKADAQHSQVALNAQALAQAAHGAAAENRGARSTWWGQQSLATRIFLLALSAVTSAGVGAVLYHLAAVAKVVAK